MPQPIVCPHCAKKLNAPDQLAGKRVKCPACQGAVDVPASIFGSRPAAQPAAAAANETKSPGSPAALASDVIVATCPQCAKQLRAPRSFAGKRAKCPACQAVVTMPGATAPSAAPARSVDRADARPSASTLPAVSDDDYELEAPIARESHIAAPRPRQAAAAAEASSSPKAPAANGRGRPVATPSSASGASLARGGRRPRFLYLLFALAFVPLGISMLANARDDSEVEDRFLRTVESQPDVASQMNEEMTDDEFFALLPDGRLIGAHLAHETWVHWLYGIAAAAAFMAAIRLLFEPGESTWPQLLATMLITATAGVVSLLMFQWIAEFSQGWWVRGRSIVVVVFYIVKFIGFSYRAALDPENGFLLSMLGFTFGVGLCEELVKVIPAIGLLKEDKKLDWRAPCALGLVSGVGFGVAEGIMYSSQMYNGVAFGDIYVVRFISCVALHAVWAASASIFAAERIASQQAEEFGELVLNALIAIAVPAVLHGLYDTLLKRDMPGYALVAAAASFVWLIFVIERARSFDASDRPALKAAMA
jgi:RsiW-degrading membrane proteinase PrsW (M82 family)